MLVVRSSLACLLSLVSIFTAACDSDGGDSMLDGDEKIVGVVFDEQGPVAGATVSVFGTAAATTTNDGGQFALEAPRGTSDLLVEAAGHWGALRRVHLQAEEVLDDLEVELVPDATVGEVASALGRPIDEGRGVFLIEFFAAGAPLGGERAELDVDADPPFTFDEDGDPVDSSTLLEGDGEAELVYPNVPVGDLDLIVFGDDADTGCAPEFDSQFDGRWPVAAKVISRARAFCGPI